MFQSFPTANRRPSPASVRYTDVKTPPHHLSQEFFLSQKASPGSGVLWSNTTQLSRVILITKFCPWFYGGGKCRPMISCISEGQRRKVSSGPFTDAPRSGSWNSRGVIFPEPGAKPCWALAVRQSREVLNYQVAECTFPSQSSLRIVTFTCLLLVCNVLSESRNVGMQQFLLFWFLPIPFRQMPIHFKVSCARFQSTLRRASCILFLLIYASEILC